MILRPYKAACSPAWQVCLYIPWQWQSQRRGQRLLAEKDRAPRRATSKDDRSNVNGSHSHLWSPSAQQLLSTARHRGPPEPLGNMICIFFCRSPLFQLLEGQQSADRVLCTEEEAPCERWDFPLRQGRFAFTWSFCSFPYKCADNRRPAGRQMRRPHLHILTDNWSRPINLVERRPSRIRTRGHQGAWAKTHKLLLTYTHVSHPRLSPFFFLFIYQKVIS